MSIVIKSLVIISFVIIGFGAQAQSTTGTAEPGKENTNVNTNVTPTDALKKEVKAVPIAKNRAKPERVDNSTGNSARSTSARPAASRPARSTRPSGRPVTPGRVR